jgi:hypothetical protein
MDFYFNLFNSHSALLKPKTLAQQKGVERNLLIKRSIKDIIYSRDQIQINLYFSRDFGAIKNSVLPYKNDGVGIGGDKKEKGASAFLSKSPQFEILRLAPPSKCARTVPIILPNTIHQSRMRNLKK